VTANIARPQRFAIHGEYAVACEGLGSNNVSQTCPGDLTDGPSASGVRTRWASKMSNVPRQFDAVFGDLQWSPDNPCWRGTINFLRKRLPLSIDLDLLEPSDDDWQSAIEAAKPVYAQLDGAWELKSRRDAARELTEGTFSQSDYEPTEENIDELFADMVLVSLDFTYIDDDEQAHPQLGYVARKCFPDMRISIQFNYDLSIDEVTVHE